MSKENRNLTEKDVTINKIGYINADKKVFYSCPNIRKELKKVKEFLIKNRTI